MANLRMRDRFSLALASLRGDLSKISSMTSTSLGPTVAPVELTAGKDWSSVPFAPGTPLEPWIGQQDHKTNVANNEPRTFDYVPSINVSIAPRIPYGLLPFSQLLYYAENVPEVALFIRLLTDEIKTLKPMIKDPKGDPANIPEMNWMTTYPDGFTSFPVWASRFLYNVLAYDAGALFNIYNEDQKTIRGLRVIDGSTIFTVIDQRGEQPAPPNPAFVQVVQGTPFMWLTTQQLWYRPRQVRANNPYGRTPVEDAYRAVIYLDNLWNYEGAGYIEGNTPEMAMTAPQDWTAEQVMDFEKTFNSRMSGQAGERRRVRFLPYGFTKIETKSQPWNKEGYEAAFHLLGMMFGFPLSEIGKAPGSGLGGKGYQDEGKSQHYRQGLGPIKEYLQSPFNDVLRVNGYKDYTFSLELDTEEIDQEKRSQQVIEDWMQGISSLNEAREARNYKKLPGKAGEVRIVPGNAQVVPIEEDVRDVEEQERQDKINQAHGNDLEGNKITPPPEPKIPGPKNPAPKGAVPAAPPKDPAPVNKFLEPGQPPADNQTGVMIALMLGPEPAQYLADLTTNWPDGSELTPNDEMHITLVFLGDTPDLPYDQEYLLRCLQDFCSGFVSMYGIAGHVNGIGRFLAEDGSGKDAIYANFDAPDLPSVRELLVDHLTRCGISIARDHGFTPHITLGYVPSDAPAPAADFGPFELSFSAMTLGYGANYTAIPFGASPVAAKLRKFFPRLDLLKHCGVCPEDDAYYQAPISAVTTIPFMHQGANETNVVAISPKNKEPRPALWKPASGEMPELQDWIGGPMYPREEVAFIVDRTLGFYLVPVSFVAEVNGEKGSVQHFVIDNKEAKPPYEYSGDWVQKAAVLDFILGQVDRGSHNWLTHPEEPDRPVLIDNGLTSPTADDTVINSVFVDAYAGKELDPSVLDALLYLSKKKSVWLDIEDLVGKKAADADYARVLILLENKIIPAANMNDLSSPSEG